MRVCKIWGFELYTYNKFTLLFLVSEGIFSRRGVYSSFLFQSLEELLCLEIFWNRFIVASDDFVNLFLPTRFLVFASLDATEELPKCNDNNRQEVIWHLEIKKQRKPC